MFLNKIYDPNLNGLSASSGFQANKIWRNMQKNTILVKFVDINFLIVRVWIDT